MSIANELRGTPRPVRRKLLKKIILILEALLMTAFVMAEEKNMGKFATNIELNSGYEMRRTQERASRVFDKQKLADTI